jgi:uncharacterized protein YndB with AHSA1/START domain
MIRFAYQETIAASPDTVFALMTDIRRFDEWLGMDGRPTDEGAVTVVSTFDSTGKLGPFTVDSRGEVTAYDPGRAFGFRLTAPGSFDFTVDLRLEPDGSGTRLDGRGTFSGHRMWRLLEPVLRGELQKGEAAEARRLRKLVEAGA